MNSIPINTSHFIQEKLVNQIKTRVKAAMRVQKGQYKDFGIMEQIKLIDIVTRDEQNVIDYKFAQ